MIDDRDVPRAIAGDEKACERLLRAVYSPLFGLIMRVLRDRPAAEDAAQESCLRIVRNLKHFRGEASFKTWALAIGYHAAQDSLRRRKPASRHIDLDTAPEIADPSPIGEKTVLMRQIWQEVDRMPATLRETALMVWGEGYTQSEAAAIMGCALKTVEWRLAEIKKTLGQRFKEEGA
jgi:RNA polymerase sigma-70 factor (ECF subfamily)